MLVLPFFLESYHKCLIILCVSKSIKQIHESGPCACQLLDSAELKEMEEKMRRLFSCFVNWDMWNMAKNTQTFCCFCEISVFFCRHKETDKKSKSQDQDSERHNFLLSDQKELTVKDSVEVISSKIQWEKMTFLGGITSKFLSILNYLQSLSGSQNVCVH